MIEHNQLYSIYKKDLKSIINADRQNIKIFRYQTSKIMGNIKVVTRSNYYSIIKKSMATYI